jgi:hypothetical protein
MNAIDLRPTIVAKSDQLNADDLIGTTRTVKITAVRLRDAVDQPIAIHFEGDDGKPYLPCKSMRRVMVAVWGDDGNAFVGQRMTLFRDDKVRFGSDAVGGIRISHMSGIDREKTLALMVTRGQRKPYTVRPLPPETGAQRQPEVDLPAIIADGRAAALQGSLALGAWWSELNRAEKAAAKPALDAELKPAAARIDQAAMADATNPEADEIIESDLEAVDDIREEDMHPGNKTAEHPAVAWGRNFLAWIPSAQPKALTEAWAEAKREGKTAALQNADPGLFDDVIAAKERRLDATRGGR